MIVPDAVRFVRSSEPEEFAAVVPILQTPAADRVIVTSGTFVLPLEQAKYCDEPRHSPTLLRRKFAPAESDISPVPPPLGTVIPPADDTLNLLLPATCRSRRFPPNPLAALTPNPVPDVDHAVDVVPDGSTRMCGFVVVAVPPVNQVPVSTVAGEDTREV
jgi:hypothetical protein